MTLSFTDVSFIMVTSWENPLPGAGEFFAAVPKVARLSYVLVTRSAIHSWD